MKIRKGILVVFEGIDGAGKSTQAKILMENLQAKGFEVVYFREPSKGKWGREIKRKALHPDSLSPEQELDLFQKDREENVKENLKPALDRKKIVILDRYYYSTMAYQGAKGIDENIIRQMNERFVIKPDLVFILDIDPEKGLRRIENRKRKDRLFEQENYLVKVREKFNSFKGKHITHIDALSPVDEISSEIETIVMEYIQKV